MYWDDIKFGSKKCCLVRLIFWGSFDLMSKTTPYFFLFQVKFGSVTRFNIKLIQKLYYRHALDICQHSLNTWDLFCLLIPPRFGGSMQVNSDIVSSLFPTFYIGSWDVLRRTATTSPWASLKLIRLIGSSWRQRWLAYLQNDEP